MQAATKLRWCVILLAVFLGVIGLGGIVGELVKGIKRMDVLQMLGSLASAVVPAGLLWRYARVLRRTEADAADSPALRAQLTVAVYFVGLMAATMILVGAAFIYVRAH